MTKDDNNGNLYIFKIEKIVSKYKILNKNKIINK